MMPVLEEPLRIAASAIEPIEPFLDAVGAAVDLIVTPVVKFLTDTLDLNDFLDGITDQIEPFLLDFNPLENFEAQVNALIAELTNFTAATMGEIDTLLSNVETAIEKVGGGPIKILHARPGQSSIDYGSEEIGTDVEILAFNNIVFDNIQDAIIGGSVLLGDINADKDDLLILNTSGSTVNGYHQANGLTDDDSIYGTAEADHLMLSSPTPRTCI